MDKKAETRKWVVKAVVWMVVIAAVLLTAHVVVNYFDLLGFLRKLHGG